MFASKIFFYAAVVLLTAYAIYIVAKGIIVELGGMTDLSRSEKWGPMFLHLGLMLLAVFVFWRSLGG